MAELKDILEVEDFVKELITSQSLTNTPNRTEIDNALLENGYTLPLANNVSFKLISSNYKYFFVSYIQDTDKFMYIKAKDV